MINFRNAMLTIRSLLGERVSRDSVGPKLDLHASPDEPPDTLSAKARPQDPQ